MKPDPAIWREAQKLAGGADALAVKLGIARRTLFKWKTDGVPAASVAHVSAVTGISPSELRPDLAVAFRREAV